MSDEDKTEMDKARNKKKFYSSLGVFTSTMGIRPNEFSVIVAQSGNGKSTLCKTISTECAIGGMKCYHLLSEEKTAVYKSTISNVFEKMTSGKSEKFLEKLFFESMLDWDESQLKIGYFFDHLEDVVNELCPDMVIFDNFTTSFMSTLPISVQGDMISRFRKMASAYNIAILGVFHTAKGTDLYKRVLDGEDVRGNASTTNAGSYNYVLSTYFRTNPPRAIVNIDKARYHPEANKSYYELYFDKELGIYTKDRKIDYETVRAIIDDVNKSKVNRENKKWKK
jgi:RecA-family ATPase